MSAPDDTFSCGCVLQSPRSRDDGLPPVRCADYPACEFGEVEALVKANTRRIVDSHGEGEG